MLDRAAGLTDRLEHFWEDYIMRRVAGSVLVVIYLLAIVIIEINRRGFIPNPPIWLPDNHFYAVEYAFTLLLVTEVISLIFGLTRSFSRSIGIQLEILSLILLRDTFKQFTDFPEPLEWSAVEASVVPMILDAIGALTIFVILGVYYKLQRERPITHDEVEQNEFIRTKKFIALGLIVVFAIIGIEDLLRLVQGQDTFPFFDSFFTVLVFTDVLMVLVSLRYSISFAVVFRNFGFAVVTVLIRIALIAPTEVSVALGIGTALFALGMTVAYNQSGLTIYEQARNHSHQPTGTSAKPSATAYYESDQVGASATGD